MRIACLMSILVWLLAGCRNDGFWPVFSADLGETWGVASLDAGVLDASTSDADVVTPDAAMHVDAGSDAAPHPWSCDDVDSYEDLYEDYAYVFRPEVYEDVVCGADESPTFRGDDVECLPRPVYTDYLYSSSAPVAADLIKDGHVYGVSCSARGIEATRYLAEFDEARAMPYCDLSVYLDDVEYGFWFAETLMPAATLSSASAPARSVASAYGRAFACPTTDGFAIAVVHAGGVDEHTYSVPGSHQVEIAVDESGEVFVLDETARTLAHLRSSGADVVALSPSLGTIAWLVAGDGEVTALDRDRDVLVRWQWSSGELREQTVASLLDASALSACRYFYSVYSEVLPGAGTAWVACYGDDALGVYRLDGERFVETFLFDPGFVEEETEGAFAGSTHREVDDLWISPWGAAVAMYRSWYEDGERHHHYDVSYSFSTRGEPIDITSNGTSTSGYCGEEPLVDGLSIATEVDGAHAIAVTGSGMFWPDYGLDTETRLWIDPYCY